MSEIATLPFEPQNPTYTYVGAFVNELQRGGLRHAVLCPGSRSTPLALTLATHPEIRCWMQLDERCAAFFALGLAKRLNQPVVLLCTSGTAAANFFPAIVEAHLTHVPLLVLTADRPPELRECGAPQAIDQNRLYGMHVKWFVEAALPEANDASLRYIRTMANRALAYTQAVPAGPIHVNMPFREPLTPAPLPAQPLPPDEQRDPLAWQGRPANQPYTAVRRGWPSAAGLVWNFARQIEASPRGLILVGPQTDPALVELLLLVARKAGYPILADPLSQMRGRGEENDALIMSYDAFLRTEDFLIRYEPQLIIRFGAMPTSKPLLLYLKRYPACPQVLIDEQYAWEEPTQLVEQVFHVGANNFCRMLDNALNDIQQECKPRNAKERIIWTEAWLKAERVTREALALAIGDLPALFEGRVFTELADMLASGSLLYVGNSMPVRDMDTFFWPQAHALRCLGNRGANGIDGVISSALGASAADNSTGPTVLVIGDLSFYHDLNGLLAAKLHHLNLTIILVNNNGGGIFSFLPQAAYPAHFEQLFGTPTDLDFRPVVEMYGGIFQRVTNWDDFRHAFKAGLIEGGLCVIEVPTERESNVAMHRHLWQVVEQALKSAGSLMPGEAVPHGA